MRSMRGCLLGLLIALLVACSSRGRPEVHMAPNAPSDFTVQASSPQEMEALIAPYVAQARATYPSAKERFLEGLLAQHSFFVVTILRDAEGSTEQVFIAVDQIKKGKITGRIWNDITAVRGFQRGQVYTFSEAELRDWLISHPDGSEEGNFVGKFLDGLNPTSPPARALVPCDSPQDVPYDRTATTMAFTMYPGAEYKPVPTFRVCI